MRLITDIFTRADVTEESHATLPSDRLSRNPAAAPATALCVHFTGAGDEHRVWVADDDAAMASAPESPGDGMALSWQREPHGVLRGEVSFRGSVIADVLMIGAVNAAPAPHGRRSLRALGLSRSQASILAQWTGRPVLATFSRGPAFSGACLNGMHQMLLASLTRWAATKAMSPFPTRAA